MKKCPYCENELEVIDIDYEGFDILGCNECNFSEDNTNKNDDDIMFFI